MTIAKKIVVLGANGQLGSDLIKVLRANRHHQVIASTSESLDAAAGDIHGQLHQYVDADYIINCIATTNVDGCEDNPGLAFQINSAFVAQLAQFCHKNAIVLIHISTDYVFSGDKSSKYLETDNINPLNVYGLSKAAGDLAVAIYSDKYFIIRVSSLFGIAGASGKGGNFITTMQRLGREKDSWTVISDQWTCPTHTLDVARAILALIDQNVTEYGTYNCVSGSSCSWFEFTQNILELSGLDHNKVKPISYTDYNFKAQRPQRVILSNDKLSQYYVMPDYLSALREFLSLQQVAAH